jgi:hypothetical protein
MGIPEWNAIWISPELGGARFNNDTQTVAAVSRTPGNLDVFVIGFDNRVWTAYWDGTWHDWFPLPGGARFNNEVQHIAAVSRAPGNLDLFVLGYDNRLWTASWPPVRPGDVWNAWWSEDLGDARFNNDTQHVAAVSRGELNLDVFVLGFDNKMWTAFWGPQVFNPITLDASVDKASGTVPFEAKLDIRPSRGTVELTNWGLWKDGQPVMGAGGSVRGPWIDVPITIEFSQPGSYQILIERTGLTAPNTSSTLTKTLDIAARAKVPPPTPPHIEVEAKGDGSFKITGTGFLPNATVHIRMADDAFHMIWLQQSSTGTGQLEFITGKICQRPGYLHFSANDGRIDPQDPMRGPLWSNFATSTCT